MPSIINTQHNLVTADDDYDDYDDDDDDKEDDTLRVCNTAAEFDLNNVQQ